MLLLRSSEACWSFRLWPNMRGRSLRSLMISGLGSSRPRKEMGVQELIHKQCVLFMSMECYRRVGVGQEEPLRHGAWFGIGGSWIRSLKISCC
ncbi:hypothetical protein IEQ34_014002 [Dendrobium chrysotoxum]|uniref:Uncharacterized protein n=1 Tax=Dendrobium chrysotoxum TaxID=161865 RepID=A0AAV7GJZ0_DENCH|nr:hypothetical protein IEQ34_014002 [Dendrobium chrysotoxum]